MTTKLALAATAAAMFASTACAPTVSTLSNEAGARSSVLRTNTIPKPSPTILRSVGNDTHLRGWMNPLAKGSETLIYVADGNQVLIFPERGFNQQPIGAITDGVSGAYGLYVDGNRNLYVANSTTISAYHPGTLHPWIVYNDSASPLYVAKDYDGRIYGANRDGTVTEFLPKQTAPFRTFRTPGVEADGINIDVAGNMYVAYRDGSGVGSIKEFHPNSRNGHIIGMQLVELQGLQLDRSGNILVVETGDKQVVDIFSPGSKTPSKVVQAPYGVTQVVLQEANELMYVSSFSESSVYVSPYPPGQFEVKDSTGYYGVQGVAVSNEER